MKVSIINTQGAETGRELELPAGIFGIEPNQHAVWLDVKSYLANQRQGTANTKERNDISGSTRKLHKQKGTGGSRKGSIKNPVFRGGGTVFGPHPRDYTDKINKDEVYDAGCDSIMSKEDFKKVVNNILQF